MNNIVQYANEYKNYAKSRRNAVKPARWFRLNKPDATQIEQEIFVWLIKASKAISQNEISIKIASIKEAYSNNGVWTPMTNKPVECFYSSIGVTHCVTAWKNDTMIGRALIWDQPLVGGLGVVDFQHAEEPFTRDMAKWAIRTWGISNGRAVLFKHDFTNGHIWLMPDGSLNQQFPAPWETEGQISLADMFTPYMDTFYQAEGSRLWAGNCPSNHIVLANI